MRILFDIGHPAHVHFFKNAIWSLKEKSHEVIITARNKEVSFDLLDAFGLPYINLGKNKKGIFNKGLGMLKIDYDLYRIAKNFQPDILVGVHNPYIAQVGKILNRRSITFTDTEYVKLASILTFPFTDVICTPLSFKRNFYSKHIRYNGYKELAYLHPRYFIPDIKVLDDIGLNKDDPFIILRFISWGSSHDTGLSGIKKGTEMKFIKALERFGKVFISSEKKIDPHLASYGLPISPEKFHSLMSFARLYIGEGGTTALESAMLGTPSIHIESANLDKPSAASIFCGNFIELRDKYDLVHMFTNQDNALEKAIEILEDKFSKHKWQIKKDILINEKDDVTEFMVKTIERYGVGES